MNFGRFVEDNCFLSTPLSLLLTPPDNLAPFLPLDCLARELSLACKTHQRPFPTSIDEVRQWAAETGPFDMPFEVIRRLITTLRFCVMMNFSTFEGWATGVLPGGAARTTTGPAPTG